MSERGRWVYMAGGGDKAWAENEARWVWVEDEDDDQSED